MYTDYIEDENSEDYYDDQGNDNKDKIKKIILFVGIFVIALILIVLIFFSFLELKHYKIDHVVQLV